MGGGMHYRTLQARYDTHKGFSFLFYCQECFKCKDEWINKDEIERRLNALESLRAVARAADNYRMWEQPDDSVTTALAEALDAVPAWVLDTESE